MLKSCKLSFVAKSWHTVFLKNRNKANQVIPSLGFETFLRCFYFSYFILLTGSSPVPATTWDKEEILFLQNYSASFSYLSEKYFDPKMEEFASQQGLEYHFEYSEESFIRFY